LILDFRLRIAVLKRCNPLFLNYEKIISVRFIIERDRRRYGAG
jgi:hypothetical protein